LASITSSAEQAFLEATFLSGNSISNAYWIGFSDFSSEGKWAWSSGEPMTFIHWHTGEPKNENDSEDGAVMGWHYSKGYGGFADWNDISENRESFYGIMETPTPYPVEVIPETLIATLGSNAIFRAQIYGLSEPISYQWCLNGIRLPSETNTALSLTNLNRNQTGDYSV
jgi:hypothetical protein